MDGTGPRRFQTHIDDRSGLFRYGRETAPISGRHARPRAGDGGGDTGWSRLWSRTEFYVVEIKVPTKRVQHAQLSCTLFASPRKTQQPAAPAGNAVENLPEAIRIKDTLAEILRLSRKPRDNARGGFGVERVPYFRILEGSLPCCGTLSLRTFGLRRFGSQRFGSWRFGRFHSRRLLFRRGRNADGLGFRNRAWWRRTSRACRRFWGSGRLPFGSLRCGRPGSKVV